MATTEPPIAIIIGLTERLSALLAAENAMLASERSAEIAAHREEKERLTRAYGVEMAALRARPKWLTASPPADIDRLKTATGHFQKLLKQHRQALLAAKTVTERMFKAIGDEVVKRRRPLEGYDENAAMKFLANARSAPAIPVALNQVV